MSGVKHLDSLRVCCWNIWFSDVQLDARMAMITHELQAARADVVVLHEVRDRNRCAAH